MFTLSTAVLFVALRFLVLLVAPSSPVEAAPTGYNTTGINSTTPQSSSSYWLSNIQRQGTAAFGDTSYQIFRNVQDFGAKGYVPGRAI